MGPFVGILALSACLRVGRVHSIMQNASTCCSAVATSVRETAEPSLPARPARCTLLSQIPCQLHLLLQDWQTRSL